MQCLGSFTFIAFLFDTKISVRLLTCILILTLFRPMEFSPQLHEIKSEWSLIYTEGSQVTFFPKYCISYLNVNFVIANSADPGEMPHYAAFHLGLRCLPKYLFRGFPSLKGKHACMRGSRKFCQRGSNSDNVLLHYLIS